MKSKERKRKLSEYSVAIIGLIILLIGAGVAVGGSFAECYDARTACISLGSSLAGGAFGVWGVWLSDRSQKQRDKEQERKSYKPEILYVTSSDLGSTLGISFVSDSSNNTIYSNNRLTFKNSKKVPFEIKEIVVDGRVIVERKEEDKEEGNEGANDIKKAEKITYKPLTTAFIDQDIYFSLIFYYPGKWYSVLLRIKGMNEEDYIKRIERNDCCIEIKDGETENESK